MCKMRRACPFMSCPDTLQSTFLPPALQQEGVRRNVAGLGRGLRASERLLTAPSSSATKRCVEEQQRKGEGNREDTQRAKQEKKGGGERGREHAGERRAPRTAGRERWHGSGEGGTRAVPQAQLLFPSLLGAHCRSQAPGLSHTLSSPSPGEVAWIIPKSEGTHTG